MSRPTNKNLRPARTTEEARSRGKIGGIASGKSRRIKKTLKQIFLEMSETTISDENLKKRLKEIYPNLNPNEITDKIAMYHALRVKAIKGDVAAFNALRDTMGEKPVDKKDITIDSPIRININDNI